jgi:hypothetical protein
MSIKTKIMEAVAPRSLVDQLREDKALAEKYDREVAELEDQFSTLNARMGDEYIAADQAGDNGKAAKLEAELSNLNIKLGAKRKARNRAHQRIVETQEKIDAEMKEQRVSDLDKRMNKVDRAIARLQTALQEYTSAFLLSLETISEAQSVLINAGHRDGDTGLTPPELLHFIGRELTRLNPVAPSDRVVTVPGAVTAIMQGNPARWPSIVEEYKRRREYVVQRLREGPVRHYQHTPPQPAAFPGKAPTEPSIVTANLNGEAAAPIGTTVTAAQAQAMSGKGRVTLLDQTAGRARKEG